MGLKAYIPFTNARRERLYALGLQKQLGDAEVLLQIEWPDGSLTYEPAVWHPETSAWLTESDKRFYQKGDGRSEFSLNGVPIVPVASTNAGVVSREAAQIANRELDGAYVDGNGKPLRVVEYDDHGEPATVEYADNDVAADGGAMQVGRDVELHYDLQDPTPGGDEYDGEAISRQDAGLYDPFPVSRHEADQAVRFAQQAGDVGNNVIKILLYGIAIGFGLIVGFLVLMWFLGQVGGGSGAVSVGMYAGAML